MSSHPSSGDPVCWPAAWLPAYLLDAWQRSVLFADVLRRRGNQYFEHQAMSAPNVLGFKVELVADGRTLARPVNYGLVRILDPSGGPVDKSKRPFVVVDPRAGHGPGIGGMKQESEIGIALAAGHPCYFVGFLPDPVPGQTIEDVCRAEAHFLRIVAERHPGADGKPAVIGNCQAGWQLMMTAAVVPDAFGPLILAGSPLSYWAGVRGKNPLRYLGGTLGGTWLTALAGDLGGGIFDGANLVANFEQMNPANTYWKKPYNVYANVDTEADRFLGFEAWWGGPVLLNAEEMQWIADNLFVGNKLTAGEIRTSDGVRVDLRNVRAPIIVLCSWGDDITPPQQALGWITDLYATDDELLASGRTIVYTLHQSIGHLGIFVSAKVATKEHDELINAIDMIDMLPPGLYEAVITEVDATTAHPELIQGRYLFRLEARGLDAIRALGNNDAEDTMRFETVARLSEIGQGLYRTALAPAVRAVTTEAGAAMARQLHPNRLRFAAFSDRNPAMAPVAAMAEQVRNGRRKVDEDNPFRVLEHAASELIATNLEALGRLRDTMTEAMFLGLYGAPLLQAAVGLGTADAGTRARSERDVLREQLAAQREAALEPRFETGGLSEAGLRALIYICLPSGVADERGFHVLRSFRDAQPPQQRLSPAKLKALFAEQFLLLRRDEARAVRAIPTLLPDEPKGRQTVLEAIRRVVRARGKLPEACASRLAEIEAMFGAEPARSDAASLAHA